MSGRSPTCGSSTCTPRSASARATPRFSWIVDHAQDAYELEVTAGERVVWATGVVESAESSLIEYAGEPLDLEHRVRVAGAQSLGRRVDVVGGIHVRHRPAGCRRLGRRVGRARAAGRGRRAVEHRRLDPRARSRHAARGAAAPAAAAAPAIRRARRARARAPVRDGARRVLGVRERRARRRPGARARRPTRTSTASRCSATT